MPDSTDPKAVTRVAKRLRHLVQLNEPRLGGPYQGYAAQKCVEAMSEAADALTALQAEAARLREALDGATIELAAARAFGGGFFADIVLEKTREFYRERARSIQPKAGTNNAG